MNLDNKMLQMAGKKLTSNIIRNWSFFLLIHKLNLKSFAINLSIYLIPLIKLN